MALQYAAENAGEGSARNALYTRDFLQKADIAEAVQLKALYGMHLHEEDDRRIVTLDYAALLDALIKGRMAGESTETLAYLFHEALAEGVAAVCEKIRARTGLKIVALSGGCFCNRLLLGLTRNRLEHANFQVLTHRQVPANDGGIALGQAVYAMQRMQADKAPR